MSHSVPGVWFCPPAALTAPWWAGGCSQVRQAQGWIYPQLRQQRPEEEEEEEELLKERRSPVEPIRGGRGLEHIAGPKVIGLG